MKPQLLRAAILEVLDEIGPAALQPMIMLSLRVLLGVRATHTDVRTALDALEQERCVVGLTSDDGEAKWTLTDNGRGVLAELRQ